MPLSSKSFRLLCERIFPRCISFADFFSNLFSFAARKKKSATLGGGKLSRPVGRISRKKTQEELWLYFPDFSLSVDVFPWPCYVLCRFFGRRPEGRKKYLERDETIETNYTKKSEKVRRRREKNWGSGKNIKWKERNVAAVNRMVHTH